MASKILETLLADIKVAMKARDAATLATLRSLHAQIKDASVNQGKEETDEIVIAVIGKAMKQRKDSIEQFESGGRQDLADKEAAEVKQLEKYQPKQLSEAEIERLVSTVIQTIGAAGKQDMGKVMKELMPEVKGKADGKLVNQVVMRLLG